MSHLSAARRFSGSALFALLSLLSVTPAVLGQGIGLSVPLNLPLLNGEVHQMRVQCAVCRGRCGSSIGVNPVASGATMLDFGGLGNHYSPNRTEIVELEVQRGQNLTSANAYVCRFELRHYQTAADAFVPPVPADEITASNLWRAARCGTAVVSVVEGTYRPTGSTVETKPLRMTGIPREN